MIEPALTKEQWAAEARGDVVRIVRDRARPDRVWSWLEVGGRASIADVDEIAATGALCNHLLPDDDPRKITMADVEQLRHAIAWAYYDSRDGECPFCHKNEGWKMSYPPLCISCGERLPHRPDDDALPLLADKLAALLPPDA